ncbi:putative cobalt-factor III C(17)-methyltransferase [Baekduia alba]|uniref:precorrin-3B C(17)-methyltransferase n=1 Tax=Baekduia alba TaxID=2997333 RepID=UPI0023417F74|nr:precorrin-3B C(17)-methyltransferase [Baekduia alba]WCB93017.1 putative cobalt-factor III C(17)-methyltransferase [Baekduia alba]
MTSGVLHIVGLGPGGAAHRTPAATAAVTGAEVVVGYTTYVDAVADLLDPRQRVVRGVMGEEDRRADEALVLAAEGARVALVSSGDAGVHGMAARTLARAAELDADERPQVIVLPGVSAAQAAAAAAGAPLTDDFAVLSLSDISMPWARVERRLDALAGSGLALALYNPRSSRRAAGFDRALELLRAARGEATPVVLAHDVTRPDERIERTTLGALDPERVTMRTVVLVSGDSAAEVGPWLVALRGPVGAAT